MAVPRYHDLTGASQVYWSRRFKALLSKMLAVVVGSWLQGWNVYNFGRLVSGGLGNNVSQVLENIEWNIETVLEFAIVSRYLLTAVMAAYFESKLPASIYFASDCQQVGLDLDYIQFERVVHLQELAVKMTRQQSGLNLDSGWNTPGDTNQSQVDILST
jgi:hypothetical protein